VLMLISFFVCPIGSHAAYIIHLKTGGRFVTPQYWEDKGGMITFFVAGGTMGIEKNTVKSIERSKFDDESALPRTEHAVPVAIQTKGKTLSDVHEKTIPKANTTKEKVDLNAYREKMTELKAEENEAWKRLSEAIRDKDKDAEARANEDRQKIYIKRRDLTADLEEKNDGKLPDDWNK